MKNFFKTSLLILLTAVFFQSCNTNESDEEPVSDELTITTELADKITATATSLNDFNFLEKYAVNGCNFFVFGYFSTPQGYNSEHFLMEVDWSLPAFYEKKQIAIESTGENFTNDDFFISSLITEDPGTWVDSRVSFNRKSHIDYFDDCDYEEDTKWLANIPLSEATFDCNDETKAIYLIQNSHLLEATLSSGLTPIENELITYNSQRNTSFTLDDVTIGALRYISPYTEQDVLLSEEKVIQNYFNNCSLARDINDNDCLNFVYPLQVNRTNQQTNEVITLENDDDLATSFSTNADELTFVFPINLLGANGTVVTIESNEILDNTLDSSATYCE